MCFIGYTIKSFNDYKRDLDARNDYIVRVNEYNTFVAKGQDIDAIRRTSRPSYYNEPILTVGVLICRAIASICPVINLWAMFADLDLFGNFFHVICRIFDQPLIGKPSVTFVDGGKNDERK